MTPRLFAALVFAAPFFAAPFFAAPFFAGSLSNAFGQDLAVTDGLPLDRTASRGIVTRDPSTIVNATASSGSSTPDAAFLPIIRRIS